VTLRSEVDTQENVLKYIVFQHRHLG